ncbi:MAG TPA: exodeoxyribonuclease VII large subunit [Frankiaceae bacterium]|nr:exodeoxyribonuclease VII large subunit [Frankiaceae bacterium]
MGLDTSAESPLPVRTVARQIAGWIGRLGRIWVEGQVTEISRRPGMRTAFITLRDPVADVSLRVACSPALVAGLQDGARVVLWGQPEMHLTRGSLQLVAYDIRPVGVGELLARLERLKAVLAAEGLFAASRKRSLPFLPGTVGLITGRGSAAERDVVENARRRWPAVRIALREVAVQGPLAVSEVSAALRELDRAPEVEVIVLARGGGSLEDLLPFSDEALVRLVADARTPVVSAIGHEQDTPLLDLVADLRCSTPTDAAKRVVPDVGEQLTLVTGLRGRAHRAVAGRLEAEQHRLDGLRHRPVLATPERDLERRSGEVGALRDRGTRSLAAALDRAESGLVHSVARVRAMSPLATLERGYAVVQRSDGSVLRSADDAADGESLDVRLAAGRLNVSVDGRVPEVVP